MARKKETVEVTDTEVKADIAAIEHTADLEADPEIDNYDEVNTPDLEPAEQVAETIQVKEVLTRDAVNVLKYSHANIPIYITPDNAVLVARATNIVLTGVVIGKFAQCTYAWNKIIRAGYTPITPEIKKILM